jgi:hypothetical protein
VERPASPAWHAGACPLTAHARDAPQVDTLEEKLSNQQRGFYSGILDVEVRS